MAIFSWWGGDGSFNDSNHWLSDNVTPAGPPTPDDSIRDRYVSPNQQVQNVTAGDLVVRNFMTMQGGFQIGLTVNAQSFTVLGRTTGGGSGGAEIVGYTTLNVAGLMSLDGDTANHAGTFAVYGIQDGSLDPAQLTAGTLVVGAAGFGHLFVGAGVGNDAAGTVTVSGNLIVGDQAGSNGKIELLDREDRLEAQSGATIGNFGTGLLLVRAGVGAHANTFDATGQDVALGREKGSNGTINLFGKMLAQDVTVGNSGKGTFLISSVDADVTNVDAAAILTGDLTVAMLAGSTGTVTVEEGAALEAVNIGLGGASKTLGTMTVANTLSGTGVIFHSLLAVGLGAGGRGQLDVIEGGYVQGDADSDLSVGTAVNSTGGVNVRDAGSEIVASHVQVGGSGTGTINITDGGKLTVGADLRIGTATGKTAIVAVGSGPIDTSL